jgi:hypothetical protein
MALQEKHVPENTDNTKRKLQFKSRKHGHKYYMTLRGPSRLQVSQIMTERT